MRPAVSAFMLKGSCAGGGARGQYLGHHRLSYISKTS